MEPNAQVRRPRFTPVTPKRKFELTDRVFGILHNLYKYGLLNSEHLQGLCSGSEQKTARRLRDLFDHGYITKFDTKTDLTKPGSEKDVYALTDHGANLLSHQFGIPRLRVRYNDNNRRRTLATIPHALMVSEIMVRFEVACGASSRAAFVSQQAVLDGAPPRTRESKSPLYWKSNVPGHGKLIGNNPDHLFGIQDEEREEGRNRAFFFLEADRGTESVIPRRNNFEKSTPYKKLHAYLASHVDKLHREVFDIPNFRVLTVTLPTGRDRDGRTRLENMMAAGREVTGGKLGEIFLFTDYATFLSGNPLTDVTWYTMHQDERWIL